MKLVLGLLLKFPLTSRNSVSRSSLSLAGKTLTLFFCPSPFYFLRHMFSHPNFLLEFLSAVSVYSPRSHATRRPLSEDSLLLQSQNIILFFWLPQARAYQSVKKSLLGRKREDHVHDTREKHLGVAVHVFRLPDKDNCVFFLLSFSFPKSVRCAEGKITTFLVKICKVGVHFSKLFFR